MDFSDNKSLHICFSYPYGNGFDPAFIQSIIGLLLHEIPKLKEERILGSILKKGSCYVDSNRSELAVEFCNDTKDDWLLMIDPDIAFPPNILELLANHITKNPNARIIAGRVNLMNGLPVFYKITRKGQEHQPFVFSGLKEFDIIGTGIICIHREVFKKISEKDKHLYFFQRIISREGFSLGDDFSFCLRAKRAGFKLYGAWDVFGQHWKTMPCPQAYPDLKDLYPK